MLLRQPFTTTYIREDFHTPYELHNREQLPHSLIFQQYDWIYYREKSVSASSQCRAVNYAYAIAGLGVKVTGDILVRGVQKKRGIRQMNPC